MDRAEENVTLLLNRVSAGDQQASAELFGTVYDELRRRARQYMARERVNHTLQATAVVNEAYMKLLGGAAGGRLSWQGSRHFFNAAAEAMRNILVDHARSKRAEKRGGSRQAVPMDSLNEPAHSVESDDVDLEALDSALVKLKSHDPRQHQVVMYRYFAGLPDQQIAQLLEVSDKTVQRDWKAAKLFLLSEMSDPSAAAEGGDARR